MKYKDFLECVNKLDELTIKINKVQDEQNENFIIIYEKLDKIGKTIDNTNNTLDRIITKLT